MLSDVGHSVRSSQETDRLAHVTRCMPSSTRCFFQFSKLNPPPRKLRIKFVNIIIKVYIDCITSKYNFHALHVYIQYGVYKHWNLCWVIAIVLAAFALSFIITETAKQRLIVYLLLKWYNTYIYISINASYVLLIRRCTEAIQWLAQQQNNGHQRISHLILIVINLYLSSSE